jgi:hypothetical protein
MKTALLVMLVLALAALAALWLWRLADHRADRAEWARLAALQPQDPARFDPAMVAALPEPARRFFAFAIEPGAPLYTVAELDMTGRFSLGTKQAPAYLPMTARQILAAPQGFLWTMSAADGLMRVSGSDSGSWTRFWLLGLGPVARSGGTADHARSAFGRYVAEAVFWTPAALLPGPGVRWEPVDDDTARVTVTHGGMEQPVDLTVDVEGRPLQVALPRWTDANPDRQFRLQPFGGVLSEYRRFGGYRLPTHVEAGNFFGTDDWFPFFIADIADIRFPEPVNGR